MLTEVIELAKTVYPKFKDMTPEQGRVELEKMYGADLDDDHPEDFVKVMKRLKQRKAAGAFNPPLDKTQPMTATVKEYINETTLTNWRQGDVIVHNMRREWGRGVIIATEPYSLNGKLMQKCHINFQEVGTKTLIVNSGMLVRSK
jgi:hypothetical protein